MVEVDPDQKLLLVWNLVDLVDQQVRCSKGTTRGVEPHTRIRTFNLLVAHRHRKLLKLSKVRWLFIVSMSGTLAT